MSRLADIRELISACRRGDIQYVREILQIHRNFKGSDWLSAQDDTGETALHRAVEGGHLEIIHLLIKAGCKVDVVNKVGETVLHRAVEGGHLEIVHLLIKAGCNVDAVNVYGMTALMIASIYKIEIVKLLISAGCNVNIVNKVDETALHIAVEGGHLEIIHLLIKAGCNVDAVNVYGMTALMIASIYKIEIVKLLISAGCNVNVVNKVGETALHKAVEEGHLELVHLFIKAGCKVNVAYLNDKCTLLIAISHRNTELVKCLLKVGCNVNVANKVGETALHRAVEEGHLEIVHLLIKAGCKVDIAFLNDKCTLLNAASHGNTELVECLLKVGCNVNVANKVGETALHKAVEGGHLEIVHLFIKAGCKVDAVNVYGETVLMIASTYNMIEIVKVLISAGCNVNVVNKVGETALHKVVEEGHLEIVHLLIKAGCKVDAVNIDGRTALMKASICNKIEIVKLLISASCNVNVVNKVGETALHKAVEEGHLEIVHLLIKAGCKVDAVNIDGRTALMIASICNKIEIVKLLISASCNVNVVNKVGETALHKAVEEGHLELVHLFIKAGCKVNVAYLNDKCTLLIAISHRNTELVKCLLKVGCNVNVANKVGETALHRAVEEGHLEIVHLLIKAGCKVDIAFLNDKCTLLNAASHGNTELVECLLKVGCNVNVANEVGETALHKAVEGGHLEIVDLLILENCKVNLRDDRDRTALHYSAEATDPAIPLMLLEVGADLDAQDKNGKTFADLANYNLLQSVKNHLLSLESRTMVCVIGHPKVGKSTLVEAVRQSTKDYWFKGIRNVKSITNRTAGIDVKSLRSEKYGKMLFFDFAGQSEYYSSHYAFLEAALSSRGTIITFLMVVDLRIPYKERVDQCMEWLSPIKSICSENVQLQIILIGSHLDTFGRKLEVVDSHATCFQTLKSKINHDIVEFVDHITMDCRKLASQGLKQLGSYFEGSKRQTLDKHVTKIIASQMSLRACFFWKKVKNHSFTQLKNLVDNLSSHYTISLIHERCQDLSSAGLAIYLPNKETLEDGVLILEMEEVITDIYGKLFAPESDEFPMHHKDLANKFGLVQSRELDQAFKGSNLRPELIKELLISMEFCHPVDSNCLRDEIRSLLVNQDGWLYFPSLVSQDAPSNPFGSSPSDAQSCVWLCWELRGLEYPFLSPRFQHSIFLRLAHKFVQKVTDDQESQILQHSCTVWKNGIIWSTVYEVDFQVQTFSSKATVQVLVRSRNGMDPLMKEAPKVIQEVMKMNEHHCPNMKTVSVLVKVKGGIPSGVQAAVSSIIKTIEKGGTAVIPYGSEGVTAIHLSEFFYDWSLSQDCLPIFRSMNQFICNVESCQGKDHQVFTDCTYTYMQRLDVICMHTN